MPKKNSNKKNESNLSLIVNRTIDLVFILIIVAFILWETFCYKDGCASKPKCFNPDEAKFYINNIIIILCPLVDSTVGIAFSAYNDKIYGLTIGDLKDTAKYHGYSFFEMIIISLFLVVVCVVLFYFNLLVTDIVVNIIGLLYCIFFTIWDVSLIARSRWRIYGIAKRKYKYEINSFKKTSAIAVSNMIYSYFESGVRQEKDKSVKSNIDKINKIVTEFDKIQFSDKNSESMKKKLASRLSKIRNKSNVNKIDKFLFHLNKYVIKGITKISKNVLDSNTIMTDFLDVVGQLIGCISSVYKCLLVRMDQYTLVSLAKYQIEVMFKTKPTNYLCSNLKTLISNMVVTDGFMSVLKRLDAKTPSDVDMCFNLQNRFLTLIPDYDVSESEHYLTQSVANINQFACTFYPNSKLVETILLNNSSWLAYVVAEAIMSFESSVKRLGLDADNDFHLNWTINSILPSIIDNQDDLCSEAVIYQNYHNLLSTSLLIKTLSNQDVWYCKEILNLYKPFVKNDGQDLNGYFYILTSFYIYYLYNQDDASINFKEQVDSLIKGQMKNVLLTILLPQGGGIADSDMLLILKGMIDTYFYYSSWNMKKENNTIDVTKKYICFDESKIIRYWFQIVDHMNYQFYLASDFEKFRKILGSSGLVDSFIGNLFKYLFEMEKLDSVKSFDYLKFYDINMRKYSQNTGHEAIYGIKKSINNWFKKKALLDTNIKNNTSLMLKNCKKVLKLIDSDLKSFTLYSNKVPQKSDNIINFKFDKNIDYGDLQNGDAKYVARHGIIANFQKEVVIGIFNKIYEIVKSSTPSHVHEINDYSQNDVGHIRTLSYSNRFIGYYGEGNEAEEISFESLLFAKLELQDGVRFPYDIFFADGAIKINLKLLKEPVCETLSKSDIDKEIANGDNQPIDGKYHCKQVNNAYKGVYVELTRDEYATFLKGQKIKVNFEIECTLDIDPNNIEIFKRHIKH